MTETLHSFQRLLDTMDELREKCPWDKQQTLESLRPLTIEETYELSEAVLAGDLPGVRKELGDLLLHVVFYAKIAAEQRAFGLKEVVDGLCEKLVYRHPHVFGSAEASTAGQVVERWEQLKLKEKDGNTSVLSGVPAALPALIKAQRVQEKARAVGFDQEPRGQAWGKVQEALAGLRAEVEQQDAQRMEEALGELLFSVVGAARLHGIDPETALERANKKFIRRFGRLEQATIKKGRPLAQLPPHEVRALWEQAKLRER